MIDGEKRSRRRQPAQTSSDERGFLSVKHGPWPAADRAGPRCERLKSFQLVDKNERLVFTSIVI
jgi:hypothetical protein